MQLGRVGTASVAAQARPRCLAPVPRPARFVARYKRNQDDKDHNEWRDDKMLLYTAPDERHPGAVCPASHAVRIALLEKGLPFDEIKVDLGNKPAEFSDLYHSIMPDMGMREQVPLLVDGPTTRLVDASVICAYLAREYPKEGEPLLPRGAAAQALVDLFIRQFHQRVVPAYNSVLHAPSNSPAAAEARQALADALRGLDLFLRLHTPSSEFALGPGYGWQMDSGEYEGGAAAAAAAKAAGGELVIDYLLGGFYSLAEVECTPYVALMAQLLPAWRGLDVQALCREQGLERLAAWMRACLARRSAQATAPSTETLVNAMESWEEATVLQ